MTALVILMVLSITLLAATAGFLAGHSIGSRRARRRLAPLMPTADDCMEIANLSISTDHFEEALLWLARARELAPNSARPLIEEGWIRGRLGDFAAAEDLFREAARLSRDDGDADLCLALLLATLGRDQDAENHLLTALKKSPILVIEVEDDERLTGLRGRPRVRKAIRRAHDKAGSGS